ncbi:MAG: ABC transporter ATP-binding protein [Planctomycetes bacterium]|nr:ABC transporter ATP-binding protein [Planctomycetota bacterium]
MITVSDLTKRFGPTLAVDRISFTVARGEIVGFLGPNGAGKTTTIRVLAGYHPATSGTAAVAGFDVGKDSLRVRQQIGYLPENVPIYPELRVVEYLRYRAALKGVPPRERRLAVMRAMAKAGVEEVQRKLVGNVSRGYRQRVGLADALVANPPVLILDEPTSGLDPNQRRRIKAVVRGLAEEHTVLFSSHILSEVADVASRILVIHRGTLRADGPPADLVATSAGRSLRLEAFSDPDSLLRIVGEAAGISALRVVDDTDGCVCVVGDLGPGEDPSAIIGRRLAAANIAVRALRVDMPSLEEYFQRITEGSDRGEEHEPVAAAADSPAPSARRDGEESEQ